jgi:hypothetical protein
VKAWPIQELKKRLSSIVEANATKPSETPRQDNQNNKLMQDTRTRNQGKTPMQDNKARNQGKTPKQETMA